MFFGECVSSWFLVFLEITRALIPLLALWLNGAYPVSPFRFVSPRPACSPLFHLVAFCEQNLICHFLPPSHLAWLRLAKKEGDDDGDDDDVGDEAGSGAWKKLHLASHFCLFLIYFSFYALLRLQLPPGEL